MPKFSGMVQFSLPERYAEKLTTIAAEGESLGLAAKRLIIDLLDDMPQDMPPNIDQKIQDIVRAEVEVLANGIKSYIAEFPPESDAPDIGDRLSALEKKAGRIGAQEQLIAMQKATTKEIYEDFKKMRDRLNKLETAIAQIPPDLNRKLAAIDGLLDSVADIDPFSPLTTAIMIQKSPIPQAIAPVVDIVLSHEEAAKEWGKTPQTVKKWAKDVDKWPLPWVFVEDRNHWVKRA